MENTKINNNIIYSTMSCPYCVKAKQLLTSLDLPYQEIDIGVNPDVLEELIKKTGWQTVPQIFINNKFIGGFDDLNKITQNGELKKLLK